MSQLKIRRGGHEDERALLALFDQAVEWLVARGQAGQWGSEPPSQSDIWRARVHDLATDSELYLIEQAGESVGALAVGRAPKWVPRIDARELYVHLLLTARSRQGERLGQKLLALAQSIARERSAEVLRLDCWAEAPALIRWYEGQGFTRGGSFKRRDWPGQLLSRPVAPALSTR
jgi:ribosomal protein S18 acetylase RimI-like enzyme